MLISYTMTMLYCKSFFLHITHLCCLHFNHSFLCLYQKKYPVVIWHTFFLYLGFPITLAFHYSSTAFSIAFFFCESTSIKATHNNVHDFLCQFPFLRCQFVCIYLVPWQWHHSILPMLLVNLPPPSSQKCLTLFKNHWQDICLSFVLLITKMYIIASVSTVLCSTYPGSSSILPGKCHSTPRKWGCMHHHGYTHDSRSSTCKITSLLPKQIT